MFFCLYTIVRQLQILCPCLNSPTYPDMKNPEWLKSFIQYPISQ